MVYLVPLPGLAVVALLAYSDVRTRRIPRAWTLLGVIVQLLTILAYCAVRQQDLWSIVLAVSIGSVCAIIQAALALIRPGALGLGDVGATALASLSIGILGWPAAILFWLFMGLLGIVAMVFYYHWPLSTQLTKQSIKRKPLPFVTVIVTAGLATTLASFLLSM
ncbi:hypothetical protein KIMH_06960 [Bombiscardovia apis]|uniref:Prepilin type IV endopeptidase peptidase domain-containing protein n=1 Tax=Bombiscardovia apis TaxID=2932182 RepID=A0ABM8BCG2_9BIFI|nr:prepilin peptidase [Bombiscardovia apis]BDR54585.1 hypothetical protein KIMH_06960 [Bombiscardovia apis]